MSKVRIEFDYEKRNPCIVGHGFPGTEYYISEWEARRVRHQIDTQLETLKTVPDGSVISDELVNEGIKEDGIDCDAETMARAKAMARAEVIHRLKIWLERHE